MKVRMKVHVLTTFITLLLVHMHQKEKVALEIAAQIASVNGTLVSLIIIIVQSSSGHVSPNEKYGYIQDNEKLVSSLF